MDPRFSVVLPSPDSWQLTARNPSAPSPMVVGAVVALALAFPAALTWACLFNGVATSVFWSLAAVAIAAGAAWPRTKRLRGRTQLVLRGACAVCVFGPALVLSLLPLLVGG